MEIILTIIFGLSALYFQYPSWKLAKLHLLDRGQKGSDMTTPTQESKRAETFPWKSLMPTIFILLFLIFGGLSIFHLKSELAKAKVPVQVGSVSAIPEPVLEYEVFYKTNKDGDLFFSKGSAAFEKRQYAYVQQFYARGIAMCSGPAWEWAKPVLIANDYAQNPTEAGRIKFENNVKENLTDLQNGKGYSQSENYLAHTINSYAMIRSSLPPQEQDFLDGITDQVVLLKNKMAKEGRP